MRYSPINTVSTDCTFQPSSSAGVSKQNGLNKENDFGKKDERMISQALNTRFTWAFNLECSEQLAKPRANGAGKADSRH